MSIKETAQGLGVGAAMALQAAGPLTPALVQSTDMPQGLKDATTSLVESANEAVAEGVRGQREGEDAASAEPVPEPESAEHTDPPDNDWNYELDSEMFEPSEPDTASAAEAVEAPADLSEAAGVSDAGGDASDAGPGGFLG